KTTQVAASAAQAGLNNMGWANACRLQARWRIILAVATLVAEAIGVREFREVEAKLGEMATYCTMWELAMDGLEANAHETEDGEWVLGPNRGMGVFAAQTSSRMIELLKQICGSGILMQPSENDLANPQLRPFLDQFMHGKDVSVEYKSRLFRIAHELGASSFGMRQEIYEYWHGGDPNRNRVNLVRGYDQSEYMDRIKDLCSHPLVHSDVP